MTAVNPSDRDRGLRLVGTLTSAVVAVTLLGVGATTALAADDTKQRDELKFIAAKPESTANPAVVAPAGSPAATVPRPTGSAVQTVRATPDVTTTQPKSPAAKTAHSPKPAPVLPATTTHTVAPTSAPSKPSTPKPKPTTATAPAPTAAPPPTTVPPTVPSTGS